MKKMKTKAIVLILTLSLVLAGITFVMTACNKDDNFRNERNGEPETGAFYSLQTAYDNGWICRDDLRNIAYHRTGDAQKKGFVPTAKNPETLSAETELAIKEAYLKKYCYDEIDSTIEHLEIDAYYGTYEGLVAVMVSGHVYPDCICEETVGEVKFVYSNSNTMLLWKQ